MRLWGAGFKGVLGGEREHPPSPLSFEGGRKLEVGADGGQEGVAIGVELALADAADVAELGEARGALLGHFA